MYRVGNHSVNYTYGKEEEITFKIEGFDNFFKASEFISWPLGLSLVEFLLPIMGLFGLIEKKEFA